MSSKIQIPHSLIRRALEIADNLPPLAKKKNPALAAFLGFWFGAIGLSVYLQSWREVVIPVLIFLVLVFLAVFTGGLSLLCIPVLWAAWGWRRVTASNKKLAAQDDDILEAEIVSDTPPPLRIPARQ
jgi:hypothetical protein